MENIEEIFRLCKELGYTEMWQLKAIRKPNMSVLERLKEIKRTREDMKYEFRMKKALDSMDYFVCEICGILTPRKYEGADPNTCCDCNPPEYWENSAKFERKDIE